VTPVAGITNNNHGRREHGRRSDLHLDRQQRGGGGAQQRLFEGPEQRGQFDEAMRVLDQQGHHGLVHRVFLILEQRQFDEAMRVLTDDDEHDGGLADRVLDEFCRLLTEDVFRLRDAGYDEHDTFQVFHLLALAAAREVAGFHDYEAAGGRSPTAAAAASERSRHPLPRWLAWRSERSTPEETAAAASQSVASAWVVLWTARRSA